MATPFAKYFLLLLLTATIGCRQSTPTTDSSQDAIKKTGSGEQAGSSPSAQPPLEPSLPVKKTNITTAPAKTQAGKKPQLQVPTKQVNKSPVVIPTTGFLERRGKKYFAGQLHKNGTYMLLVYEPDIRAQKFVKTVMQFLEPEQIKAAKKLAMSHDYKFQELKKRRAAILENATNDQDIAGQMLELRLDIADLVAEIRLEIRMKIMTKEQQQKSRAYFLSRRK